MYEVGRGCRVGETLHFANVGGMGDFPHVQRYTSLWVKA